MREGVRGRVRIGVFGALVLLLANGGCGGARLVVIEPHGGVVAVPRDTAANREKAKALMEQRCPGGYDIVREEEVSVGSRVRGETTTSKNIFDEIETKEEYTVRTKYEWRMHYRCR